jgi:hypothetical protein
MQLDDFTLKPEEIPELCAWAALQQKSFLKRIASFNSLWDRHVLSPVKLLGILSSYLEWNSNGTLSLLVLATMYNTQGLAKKTLRY